MRRGGPTGPAKAVLHRHHRRDLRWLPSGGLGDEPPPGGSRVDIGSSQIPEGMAENLPGTGGGYPDAAYNLIT